ncbi:hypothetical protein [Dictyobacter vulcani]|uniref:hypothetical protein n=1 Tax=Dictyobacter vulcani TaxID=2607529 RepID=UPI0018EA0D4E|nr:hypothetical protein [Dictyobacter vulcani]
MTISCKLRLLLARANVERARLGEPALSLRRLADESRVSLSVLAALHTGKSQRIDYMTIDHLLTYFNRYFQVTTDDLLNWEFAPERDLPLTYPDYPKRVPRRHRMHDHFDFLARGYYGSSYKITAKKLINYVRLAAWCRDV